MRKLFERTALIISKNFRIIWIVLTLFTLFFAWFINWHWSISRSFNDLQLVANEVSNSVDRFIEDLFQDVYTLPVYGENINKCNSGLYSALEHITLNNPHIDGINISNDKNQIICSTLPKNDAIISNTTHRRVFLGPYNLSLFDQPAYLLQQKMGYYSIGIVTVAAELKNILKTSHRYSSSIALHNTYDRKNLIRIEYDEKHKGWVLSKNIEAQSPVNSQFMFAIGKLQSIDGVLVVAFENHQTVLHNLWYSEALLTFIFLIFAYLLYLLLRNKINKRYSLHGALKLALKNREFFPEYQPLFDCELDTFTGVEVLLRWQDSEDKIIMPDFFISEAESTGLIVPITLQLAEIAFEEFQSILQEYSYFHLAFNLSALHFLDPEFFKKFFVLVNDYAIEPRQIIFEITERDLLDKNNSIFYNRMKELRDAGYSLAVDDYGTGHASISYLQNFPFNYLKIDKQFIQAIGTNAITESLNDAIIQMAKGLKLHIIAEGVETEEQVIYLSQNGVRYLQGWYYSKSLPIDKLSILLKGEKNEL